MKYEIAKKLLAVRRRVATEANFRNQLLAVRRALSVNRESATLFAMKYAIGEITFIVCGLE